MIRLPPPIEKMLGIAEIPDDLLQDALARVRTRCSKLDLSAYKRRPAQGRLEVEAIEAIVGSFRDHHPNRDIRIRDGWPHVHVTLKGTNARVEIYLGQDYDNEDGIEPFDIVVDRGPQKPSFIDNVKKAMSATHALELTEVVPKPAKKSRAQEILERGKK